MQSRVPAPLLSLVLLALVAACAPKPPQPEALTLQPAEFASLQGWSEDRQDAALPALLASCKRLLTQPAERPVGPNGLAGTVADWQAPCSALAALPPSDAGAARRFLEASFRVFATRGKDGPEGLFTGYYEPEIKGSLAPDARFPVPLYRRPDDLVEVDLGDFRADWKGMRTAGRVVSGRLKPYPDRAAIDGGALKGKRFELAWTDDPVAAFFLEIQGSGRLVQPDGTVVRLGYAAQNGGQYVAIGKLLADDGSLERPVTAQAIKAWLAAHPERAAQMMEKNPSYVFFRRLTTDGQVGAEGAVLTPGRSLAVDPAFLALALPVWLDIDYPGEPQNRLRRLMVAQDTGGAIKGPVRGDVFWGPGAEAEARAGSMQQKGRYYLLLPKAVAERRAKVS